MNNPAILPENFPIVFHKFLLTVFIPEQFVHIIFYGVIRQRDWSAIKHGPINISPEQGIELAIEQVRAGIYI